MCASVEFFIKDTIKRLRDRDDEGAVRNYLVSVLMESDNYLLRVQSVAD